MSATITVLMDLPSDDPNHDATMAALDRAIEAGGIDVSLELARTDAIRRLGDGVVVGPGSPYTDPPAVERAIGTARLQGIPLVGT
jgi:hypothetical protein